MQSESSSEERSALNAAAIAFERRLKGLLEPLVKDALLDEDVRLHASGLHDLVVAATRVDPEDLEDVGSDGVRLLQHKFVRQRVTMAAKVLEQVRITSRTLSETRAELRRLEMDVERFRAKQEEFEQEAVGAVERGEEDVARTAQADAARAREKKASKKRRVDATQKELENLRISVMRQITAHAPRNGNDVADVDGLDEAMHRPVKNSSAPAARAQVVGGSQKAWPGRHASVLWLSALSAICLSVYGVYRARKSTPTPMRMEFLHSAIRDEKDAIVFRKPNEGASRIGSLSFHAAEDLLSSFRSKCAIRREVFCKIVNEISSVSSSARHQVLRRSCTKGRGELCRLYGNMLYVGADGLAKNRGEAVAYYAHACNAGDPRGCQYLATMAATDDLLLSGYLLKRECFLKGGVGCLVNDHTVSFSVKGKTVELTGLDTPASDMFVVVRGDGPNRKISITSRRIVDTQRKYRSRIDGCESGRGDDCTELSALFHELPLSGASANELRIRGYEALCASGYGDFCTRLGAAYHNKQFGLAFDIGKSAVAFAKGCNAGDGAGCTNLAKYLWKLKKYEVSAAFYRRACLLGQPCIVPKNARAARVEGVDVELREDIYHPEILRARITNMGLRSFSMGLYDVRAQRSDDDNRTGWGTESSTQGTAQNLPTSSNVFRR